jgi:hypothetical protein
MEMLYQEKLSAQKSQRNFTLDIEIYIAYSQIHGKGVFTANKIESDTSIFLVADLNRHKKNLDWITFFGRFVNHKKNGNCVLKKEGEKYYLYSKKDIEPNEELTSDYSVLEYPFKSDIIGYKEC